MRAEFFSRKNVIKRLRFRYFFKKFRCIPIFSIGFSLGVKALNGQKSKSSWKSKQAYRWTNGMTLNRIREVNLFYVFNPLQMSATPFVSVVFRMLL